MGDDDDDLKIRRSWLPRGPVLIVVATAATVLGALVVLPRVRRWQEDRRLAALAAAAAPYERDGEALEAQLRTRFAPLIVDVDATGAPAHCPAAVSGDLPLVQRSWLAYALGHGDEPKGEDLASPAFGYLAHTTTPGFGETDQLDQRNRAYRDLLARPYVAVFAQARADPIHATSETTFEGGQTAGTLAIYDVARGAIACATELVSQADFVVAVRQDSVDGTRWAEREAEHQAIASSFWAAATTRVAELAPGARLTVK